MKRIDRTPNRLRNHWPFSRFFFFFIFSSIFNWNFLHIDPFCEFSAPTLPSIPYLIQFMASPLTMENLSTFSSPSSIFPPFWLCRVLKILLSLTQYITNYIKFPTTTIFFAELVKKRKILSLKCVWERNCKSFSFQSVSLSQIFILQVCVCEWERNLNCRLFDDSEINPVLENFY